MKIKYLLGTIRNTDQYINQNTDISHILANILYIIL